MCLVAGLGRVCLALYLADECVRLTGLLAVDKEGSLRNIIPSCFSKAYRPDCSRTQDALPQIRRVRRLALLVRRPPQPKDAYLRLLHHHGPV